MKLVRYGDIGSEKPGMIDSSGALRDLSAHVDDINGAVLGKLDELKAIDEASLPRVEGSPRLGTCVGNIGKLMCIGKNYSEHAKEMDSEVPDHPLLFMKANSAIIGPNDTVSIPRGSETTDWEVELGVVIGKAAKYISKEEALDYVAGYTIVNDVSERTFQKKISGQWTKGKSCDTFGPIGPWMVTADEVGDPQKLDLSCDISGQRMQTGNTSQMIFSVVDIISHLSGLFTLHPGDVIATGTPPGVGAGMKPHPVFLKPGDTMELRVEGLGAQRQNVVMDE